MKMAPGKNEATAPTATLGERPTGEAQAEENRSNDPPGLVVASTPLHRRRDGLTPAAT